MDIEMLGMPGSGKTYLISRLTEYVKKDGICLRNLTELSRTDLCTKIRMRMYRMLIKVLPFYRKKREALEQILKSYRGKKAQYNIVTIDVYTEALILDLFLYKKTMNSRKSYVLDEGIGQQFVNMMVNFQMDPGCITEICKVLDIPVKMVYLSCSVEEAIASAKKRNRHVCYIDELEGEELRLFQQSYYEACEIVSREMQCLRIERKSVLQENLAKMKEYMKQGG